MPSAPLQQRQFKRLQPQPQQKNPGPTIVTRSASILLGKEYFQPGRE